MGWFDEQIRLRKISDEEAFTESFINIAGSVMGSKVSMLLFDERQVIKNAIDEILKYYHVKSSEIPAEITELTAQLDYVLRPHGIMYRSVTLSGKWYANAIGAMLGKRKSDGSPVAFIPDKVKGYVFLNTQTGRYEKVSSSNRDLFEAEAVTFYKPFPQTKLRLKDLVLYMIGCITPSDVAYAVILTAVATVIGMLVPKINSIIFSNVVTSGSVSILMGITVLLICTGLSMILFSAAKTLCMTRINTRMSVYVESATMMRILSLPANFFRDFGAGELASKMGYMESICSMLISTVMSTALTSVFSLIYIFQIFRFAPALVAPALLIILTTILVSFITTLVQMKISRKSMELMSKESGMTFALVSGIQKIRLAGAEKRAFARWGNLYAEEAAYSYDPPMLIKINPVITLTVSLVGTLVIQYIAARSHVTVADYYAFNSAYGIVNGAFMGFAGMALQVAQIKPVLDQIKPILEAEPECSDNKQVLTHIGGSVELNNVSFRYGDDLPMVIDDLSLKIRSGQYVAIVGKTGCGKSTLMRLLLGFEKPMKGAIYYDGRDINTIDLKSLRKNIGSVTQNGKLFSGDLLENILISAPQLTLDDAWEAAEMAGIADDIRAMPMGMFTYVAEGGVGISGGQKQRVMIARAVAPKPKILMFDEATSALDNITQKKVADALASLKCTRIVIAHRLSTIKDCDRIIVLDGGKIIEDGTYDELIRQKGFFAELVERQRIDTDSD
ncbi:MAG: ATP-binding cassette domain-containing protein [Lachnospiraceae bacterium]|nr:ATP-binding cassette domain-containing protein [Lachnospiraceae bacterium]